MSVTVAALPPVLKIADLCFTYGTSETAIFSGLSFEVRAREFVSLVGPSGSGKTTLLSLIAGYAKAQSGSIVQTQGRPVMVFQRGALFNWLTSEANVEFPMKRRRIPSEERTRKRDELLRHVGLEQYGVRYPHELSVGMQQRLELARAWAADTELVLLDEALSSLDYFNRCKIQLLLQSLWMAERRTIISVTHDPEEACFLADRVLILKKGQNSVDNISIPFDRPRENDLRFTPDFIDLRKQVARL